MRGVLGSVSSCFTEREIGTVRLEKDSHERERDKRHTDGGDW